MAITVVSEPGYLSLSKNPIEFHLRSDTYITQQPVAPVYLLTFTTKLTTYPATLTLEWDGNVVEFTVATLITEPSGYNLPDDIASTSLNQYVTALAEDWFPANYLLERDFIIEYVTAAKIRFTAKRPGTELAITQSTTIPGGEAAWSTTTSPIAWNIKTDYTAIMDIEVEEVYGSDQWTRIGTLHSDPVLYDDAGTWKGDMKFDVHEILDGFLQAREDSPTLGATTSSIADNTNLQWRAIYAERYSILGETYTVRRVQTDIFRVLKGGMDYRDFPTLWDLETSFYGVTDKPFNTRQPLVRRVTAEEEHFLYYLTDYALVGVEKFRIEAVVYYTDGTDDTAGYQDTTTQNQWETFKYAVGFNAIGMDTQQPTKTPYKYKVRVIVLPSGPLETEWREFWLEETSRQDRFFMYENSWQGWNTLRTNGEHRAMPETSKTEGKKAVQNGYAATDHNVVQKSHGYTDVFEVSIGPKAKDEQAALRDFMNSERHYEIIDGEKVPIIVDTTAFKLEYERTGSYSFIESFKYRFAFINKGYSRR